MKVLELFSGSRSIGKVAEELWREVFSIDIVDFPETDYQVDILDLDYSKIPFIPDIIWASPPCTTYSIAACYHHRNKDRTPKTQEAEKWDKLVLKTLEIIEYFKPKYFFIENPRGILRKMPFMESIPRHTVTYCQYWDTRMKPTDIWTNSSSWTPRPMCKNWDSCHESAPRWSKTWTQGKKNAYERSIIPYQLCKEILLTCK